MPSYGERDSLTKGIKDLERRIRALETMRGADGTGSGGAGPTGPTGPPGPTAVSTDAGNFAGLGTDSLLYVQHPAVLDFNVQFDDYTLASSDVGKLVAMVDPLSMTLYVPTTAAVAWPVGGMVTVLAGDAGLVTVAAVTPGTTTVNGTPSLVTRAPWSVIYVMKRSTEAWLVWGDLT